MLQNVYYAPKCRRNLMSVAQIEKKGRVLKFKEGLARVIDDKTSQILIEARRVDNLYVVQADVINPRNQDVIKLHAASMIERNLWHRRFCHINNKSIEELRQKGLVNGLDKYKLESELCQGCCIGKSTKAPCKRINERQSKGLLELIHSDLCGPMPVNSIGGSKYVMTLIDDYSRKTMVYFLKSKDEVAPNIKNFINKVERDKGLKIKRFRTDNGLEYCNREMQDFFDRLGIKHERTCVETPQMNGVAERANRTLMDLVRSMLTSAKLPPSFWAEATSIAAYVRNRMTQSNLESGVPEGIWNNNVSSVRHLKAYGCLAYAHLPSQGRKKLDHRARACVLVGYSSQTKGYRLWDPKKREIIQTKHVRFDETRLGYEKAEDTTDQILFDFPYTEYLEEEHESDDAPVNDQESNDDIKDEELLVKYEPRLTRSQANAMRSAQRNDEKYSIKYDKQMNIRSKKIVGALDAAVEEHTSRTPKRKTKNPYGCINEPNDKVELNIMQIREPQT